ncbi:alpha/beta fold hydrolase [Nocardia aurantia]|uniref:Soluble epoxide hydrolase n=1 Tax=Nocardia aurantia TaxID=2585199 RepID=A0A7K0DKQ0_9NOCA|nr:alpha/beta hydrolase [Nocardia aurantia]MQY25802.1 Soluble epoxide hydrolase [Nocardia aurantia]
MNPVEETVSVNGIRIHHTRSGDGPALVLLHGWPQTSYCWRHLIEPLSRDHTVIAPDLRGYGHSGKPREGYDKRTMAADMSALIRHLGFESAAVVGHDRGARVAHRWALDRPAEVTRLAVLDIVPTREVWRRLDVVVARGYWHWLFHLQPDLPELLAGKDIGSYLGYFFEHWSFQRAGLAPDAVAEYVRAFSAPGALRAGFDDYRASFPGDAELDDADAAAGRRLTMPVLALWGSEGLLGSLPTLDIWRDYAENVTGRALPECGHFLPEEQPAIVARELLDFLNS